MLITAQLGDEPETQMMTFVLVEVGVVPCFEKLDITKNRCHFLGLEGKQEN